MTLTPSRNPAVRRVEGRWAKSEPERRRHVADNTYFNLQSYIETLLWIRSKQKRLIPFKLNPPQLLHYRRTQAAAEQGRTRHVILKARQMGFTTFELARMFHKCATEDLTAAALVAHEKDTTRRLLEIPKTFYEKLPPQERPPLKYDNREEYYFDGLGSRLIIGTAGALSFGRGLTLHHLVGSEVGFWPDAEQIMGGLSESIPTNGWVTLESTANGVGGYFYDTYMEAKEGQSEYAANFYPWFLDPTYQIAVEEGVDFEPTHEERDLMERVSRDWTDPVTGAPLTLTHNQLSFRRWKQDSLKVKFAQEYPEDDITCFLVSGSTVFDGLLLANLLRTLARPPLRVAEPYSVKGHEVFALKVWQEPQLGVEYVAASDTAEGEEIDTGLDFSGTIILRRDNGEQVADLHGWWPPHIFARKSAELCERYNDAFWGVERNNHGHSVLNTAENVLHYPRLYRHKTYDPRATQHEKERLGWPTDPVTKPLMIDELHEALAAGTIIIRDEAFYREAMSFLNLGNGKMGARSGTHDDRVIKAAIGHQMRKFRPKSAGVLFADDTDYDDDPMMPIPPYTNGRSPLIGRRTE